MSKKNVTEGRVQEILNFLSCLESGDYSNRVSRPEEQSILSPIIDKLNSTAQTLEAQAQAGNVIAEFRRTEKELQSLAQRLRLATSSAHMGIWDWDVKNNVMSWDERMLELYGLTKQTFSGGNEAWQNGLHPEDRERAIGESQAALRGEGNWDTEFRVLHPDGKILWIKADGIVLRGPDGTAERMLGVNADITERKRAEKELERTRNMLAEAQKIAHLGSFEYVVATEATVWSEEEYRIYGLDPTGPSPAYAEHLKCIHPDDATLLDDAFTRAIQSKSVFEHESRIVRPDGNVRWVHNRAQPYFDEQGKLVRYIGTTLDITERKMADESIQKAYAEIETKVVERTAKLLVSEEQLLQAQQIGKSGSWVYNLETNKIWGSAAGLGIFGYPPVARDLPIADIEARIPERERVHQALVDLIDKGQQYDLEYVINSADGSPPRYVHSVAKLIAKDENETPAKVIGFVQDITESKRAEEVLRETKERFASLFMEAPLGIALIDSLTGYIYEVNPEFARIAGRSREELAQIDWMRITHPDDVQKDLDNMASLNAGKIPGFQMEKRYLHKDGSIVWINMTIAPVKVIDKERPRHLCMIEDITARKRTEDVLRESEIKYRTLIEALPSGVVVHGPDTAILLFNTVATSLLGLTPNQMLGKTAIDPVWCFVKEDGLQLTLAELPVNRVLVAGEILKNLVIGIRRSDRADPVWVHCGGYPIRDANGRILQAVITFSDITVRKNFEKEREDLLLREKSARQMAESANQAKDLFLATLSHELRSPLTAILSWSQLIERGTLPPEKVKTGILTIKESALSQNQLINDLLDVSRIVTGKLGLDRQPTNVLEILMAAVETVRPSAESKSIVIEEHAEEADLYISADPARLKQSLWNIFSNSIKFTPTGGKIIVTLDKVEGVAGANARITIRDTGKGIKPEFIPYLFDRFSQADSSSIRIHGGMGLGLSLVKSLVDLQGGTVSASSPGEGYGATFTITFPLLMAERKKTRTAKLEVVAPQPAEELDLSGLKVLLVEDEEKTRIAVDLVLVALGAKVRSVSSAIEAIEVFGEFHPDVIVSDLAMPGEDGYSLIRRIRKRGRENGGDTPAVALTAYADLANREEALSAGFQAHLAKPVESGELARTILKAKKAS